MHHAKKLSTLGLCTLLFAGCTSIVDQRTGDVSHARVIVPTTYHHEIVPEFNEGESRFLQLTPDGRP